MLNNIFTLHLIILILLLFSFFITDFIQLIILGIAYLLVISFLLFLSDSDILICFLIVIDLGVFFVLITYTINTIKYLNFKYIFINIIKNTLICFIFFILCFFIFYFFILTDVKLDIKDSWFFFINFIDYYFNSFKIFYSDMHLYKEIYFNINYLEFILISILLFISLIVVYLLNSYLLNLKIILLNIYNIDNLTFKKLNSIYFFKIQNFFKQYNIPAVSRVFSKSINDSKINSSTNNR